MLWNDINGMVYTTLGFLLVIRRESYARQLLLFSLSIFTVFPFIERPLSSLFVVEYVFCIYLRRHKTILT